VKNWWETVSTEEKLDVISRFDKGEGIVDRCCNVRLSHISICMIGDNASRIAMVLSQELKCLCSKINTVLSE
jgi:hypothetical protein